MKKFIFGVLPCAIIIAFSLLSLPPSSSNAKTQDDCCVLVRVTDEYNNPLAGWELHLDCPSCPTGASCTTDVNGVCEVCGIPWLGGARVYAYNPTSSATGEVYVNCLTIPNEYWELQVR